MADLKSNLNIALLVVVLSALEKLNARSPAHVLRLAALTEQLSREEDVGAALARLEQTIFEGVDESEADEIERLRNSIGLQI